MNFYYSQEGQPVGPISKDQFESLARLGVIGPQTFVRKEGLEDWKPYQEFELKVAPVEPEPSQPETGGDFDTLGLELALAKAAAAARSAADEPPRPAPKTAKALAEIKPELGSKPEPEPEPEGRVEEREGGSPDPGAPAAEVAALAPEVPAAGTRASSDLGRRVAAKILDFLLLGLWVGMVQVPLLGTWMGAMVLPANLIGWLVSGFLYSFGFTALWGATPGKRLMGLRLVNPDRSPISRFKALQRALAEILALATLGIGYLSAATDSEKRSLMDRLAKTRVI